MTGDPKQYPSSAADKLIIRFPDGMRAQLKSAAKAAGRSMNTEVIRVLTAALGAPAGEQRAPRAEPTEDDGYERITLRIPSDLHARIGDQAREKSRSANAEIIDRLRTSFQPQAPSPAAPRMFVMLELPASALVADDPA